MYAYFEAEGLCNGVVGVRVGRQLVIDALGFWSFDGARLALSLPAGLELGAYAGYEPRPGLPLLATSRYAGDGVSRGNREALEHDAEPSFLDESRLAPALGAWFGLRALGPFSAWIGYRKVENRSRVRVAPFASAPGVQAPTFGEARTSSQRVAGSARLEWPGLASASGSAVYDLYTRLWSDLAVSVDAAPNRVLNVGGELRRSRPTFDADSIFNWFSQGATGKALGRVAYAPLRAFDTSFWWGVHWFETDADPHASSASAASNGAPERGGHNLTAGTASRLRLFPAELTLSMLAEAGERGRVAGADLALRTLLAGGLYDSLAMLSLYDWADPLRDERDATSLTYVLGAGVVTGSGLFSRSRLGIEWEHTFNRLVSQRFRVLATLELGVFR
jgi:hypothetical protein